MPERPLTLTAPEVRAVLAGRKTQHRVVLRPQPSAVDIDGAGRWYRLPHGGESLNCYDLPFAPGDRIWARETYVLESTQGYEPVPLPTDDRPIKAVDGGPDWGRYHLIPHYRATETEPSIVPENVDDEWDDRTRWRSATTMPKWAARLWRLVEDVRVERLRDISEEDAQAEGAWMVPGFRDWTMTTVREAGWECARNAFLLEAWEWRQRKPGERLADNPWVLVLTWPREERDG